MTTEDNFLSARTQIQDKITKLESDLKYWRDELTAFDRVETTIKRLGGRDMAQIAVNGQNIVVSGNGQTSGAEIANHFETKKRGDLKNQILKIVNDSDGRKMSSTEVERKMLQSGFKPAGNHFDIAVFQTLKRLSGKGLIVRKKYDGKVTFSKKI